MILVLLGTQNNSFYRLLEEVQKCIDEDIIKDKVIVQAGSTKFELKETLREIDTFIPNKLESNTEHIINIIEDFIQNV